jgi:hypothetical protein
MKMELYIDQGASQAKRCLFSGYIFHPNIIQPPSIITPHPKITENFRLTSRHVSTVLKQ